MPLEMTLVLISCIFGKVIASFQLSRTTSNLYNTLSIHNFTHRSKETYFVHCSVMSEQILNITNNKNNFPLNNTYWINEGHTHCRDG